MAAARRQLFQAVATPGKLTVAGLLADGTGARAGDFALRFLSSRLRWRRLCLSDARTEKLPQVLLRALG
jgi:hypothetical protein